MVLAAALLVAAGSLSCSGSEPGDQAAGERAPAGADTMTERSIEDVLADYSEGWMELAGVEGTGIGDCGGDPCIKVFVSRPPETFARTIPDQVEGYAVKFEATGEFEVR